METETTLADSTFFDNDFPTTNGIQMVALQPLTYTSLKDLLPAQAFYRRDSWREIPIKDPLLQHAAWAYLQPATTASKADGRTCAAKLMDGCLGLFGCFGGFFNHVISTMMKRWSWNFGRRIVLHVGDDDDSEKFD